MPKYKTVVIDPPWLVDNIGDLRALTTDVRGVYDRMTEEDILNFPIDNFAHEECYLFLWATNSKTRNKPILQLAFEILHEWGFKFHNMITWSKSQGFSAWSLLRNHTEHCLFGYRGKLDQSKTSLMPNHIHTVNQTKHSQKPVKFYQMLRAWTPKPRIDLFARQRHYGFDGWGDEYVGEGPLAKWLE